VKELPSDLELNNIPVTNPAVASWKTNNDGLVLVNCDTGISIALNSTGVMVWELIDGSRSPGDIALKIAESFTDVPDCVTEDVDACIRLLADDGFIGYEVLSG